MSQPIERFLTAVIDLKVNQGEIRSIAIRMDLISFYQAVTADVTRISWTPSQAFPPIQQQVIMGFSDVADRVNKYWALIDAQKEDR